MYALLFRVAMCVCVCVERVGVGAGYVHDEIILAGTYDADRADASRKDQQLRGPSMDHSCQTAASRRLHCVKKTSMHLRVKLGSTQVVTVPDMVRIHVNAALAGGGCSFGQVRWTVPLPLIARDGRIRVGRGHGELASWR